MQALLEFLLYGHVHEWEVLKEIQLTWENEFAQGVGKRYILRCKKCGTVKHTDIK